MFQWSPGKYFFSCWTSMKSIPLTRSGDKTLGLQFDSAIHCNLTFWHMKSRLILVQAPSQGKVAVCGPRYLSRAGTPISSWNATAAALTGPQLWLLLLRGSLRQIFIFASRPPVKTTYERLARQACSSHRWFVIWWYATHSWYLSFFLHRHYFLHTIARKFFATQLTAAVCSRSCVHDHWWKRACPAASA